ncbi:MAG: type II toxin-antitoxin system RelE/ParE family toxin [Abitibacteriaceae bacterium]|nr:type II toxin-antitoxin system RelE/ParE family toxin [Abditibacteriaceae bacterium]
MGHRKVAAQPTERSIALTPQAVKMLEIIKDRQTQLKIRDRIDSLKTEPEKKGKPLISELSGYYSIRAAGQRYRIVYQLREQTIVVLVVAIGIRKEGDKTDVYSLTKRLLRLGLLGE